MQRLEILAIIKLIIIKTSNIKSTDYYGDGPRLPYALKVAVEYSLP